MTINDSTAVGALDRTKASAGRRTHADLVGNLLAATPRQLAAVLLDTHAARAAQTTARQVYRQHVENSYTSPCSLDQRVVSRFEAMVVDAVPEQVRMLELSPVAPFGSNGVLSSVSQKTVLSTIRHTEVVADAVSVLTLEAAREAETQGAAWTGLDLGTLHRELRTQAYSRPEFTSHFHALSLVSADSTADFDSFKSRKFAEHVTTYLDVFDRAVATGLQTERITVAFSNLRILELLLKAFGVDREVISRNTRKAGFSAFETIGASLPKRVPWQELDALAASLTGSVEHLRRPLRYVSRIFAHTYDAVTSWPGSIPVDIVFDLERHNGIGYYQDLCVKISACNRAGAWFQLVDIGTNDWLSQISNRRHDRLMTGGMGTETFMKNFG